MKQSLDENNNQFEPDEIFVSYAKRKSIQRLLERTVLPHPNLRDIADFRGATLTSYISLLLLAVTIIYIFVIQFIPYYQLSTGIALILGYAVAYVFSRTDRSRVGGVINFATTAAGCYTLVAMGIRNNYTTAEAWLFGIALLVLCSPFFFSFKESQGVNVLLIASFAVFVNNVNVSNVFIYASFIGLMAVMSVFVGFAINVQSSVLRHQFATLHQSNQKWLDSQDQVIQAMTKLLFVSSAETYEHSVRVMNLSLLLAREMGITDETELKHIKHGALLHDLGKLGVPAEILNRNGALTSDERKQIEEHPLIGDSVLRPIEFLQPTLDILRYHHERWNGTGYPYRLKGENIPRHARIVAVADCWDAMVNDRIYRQALSLQTAFDDIVSKAGTSYDPQTVEVFKRVIMKEHPELIDATSNKSAFLPHLVTEMLTLSAR